MTPEAHMARMEAHRREPRCGSVTTRPLPQAYPLFPQGIDYATAGLKIQLAMTHLDEGLPGQQKQRCVDAWHALQEGVREMEAWMNENGYFR